MAPVPDPEELERLLTLAEGSIDLALLGDWERWFLVLEDGEGPEVFAEIASMSLPLMLPIELLRCRQTARQVRERAPFALRRWATIDKLYLAARDDRREESTGRYFVDVATNRLGTADRIRDLLGGGGKVRNREQMLNDPDLPGLADALTRWEDGDDSLQAAVEQWWASRLIEAGQPKWASDRAKARWGRLQD
jgi:hypothetical protein